MRKILLVDKMKTRYAFTSSGEVYINDKPEGKGWLDINNIALFKSVKFKIGNKEWNTHPLIGCLVVEKEDGQL